MTQAQDFTKIHTKSYKVWRILQAPGVWASIYRNREEILRNYRSAIIFPEQLLGLNQGNIFSASLSMNNDMRSASVAKVNRITLLLDRDPVSNFQEIYDWESEHHDAKAVGLIKLGSPVSYGSDIKFCDLNLFTNRKDAVKMATKYLEAF